MRGATASDRPAWYCSFANIMMPLLLVLEIDHADGGQIETTGDRVYDHYEIDAAAHSLETARTSDEVEDPLIGKRGCI